MLTAGGVTTPRILTAMTTPASTSAPADFPALQLFRRRDAAKLLRLSERTLFNLDKSGELRSLRIGGHPRYSAADLQGYLAKLAANRDAS
jgi:excisionase family DNA binding protein